MDLLTTPPPDIDAGSVVDALRRRYGLAARVRPLPGERDRNFRVEAEDGTLAVLKLHNAADPPEVRALARDVLVHLEGERLPFAVPRLVRTREGAGCCTIDGHEAMLTTFVAGVPWDALPAGPGLRRAVGEAAAALGGALRHFAPAAARRSLPWDLMRLDRMAPVAAAMTDRRRGDWLAAFVERFVAAVRPAAEALPAGSLHNDLNGSNVLFAAGAVGGVIDFGDLLHGPRIVDLAVAATYGLGDALDPAEAVAQGVEGWLRAAPLGADEADVLFDLALARLVLRVLIYEWRAARAPGERGYVMRHAAAASGVLDRVMASPPHHGRAHILARWRETR